MSARESLLEARQVRRRAPDGTWLLDCVSLALPAGGRLALLGPSGAGKSLLLRALALLDPLDGGDVLWHGQPVADADVPAFRGQVIYLHQRPALFEGDVESNLRLPYGLAAHRHQAFDKIHVVRLLAALGRGDSFLAKSQRDLSGGEAQMVALLRAVQLAPAVLLLDEPTAALDPDSTRRIEALVACWLQEAPAARALVWVSHDQAQAERVADRKLYLRGGKVEGDR